MITRRALCVVLASAPALLRAESLSPLLREVRQRLVNEPVVRGGFEQHKTVKGFRNPLVSSGDFVVARGQGVLWRTRQPFASTLVVTRDRVLARQADGTVVRRLNANEEPAVRAVSETLFGVMAAEFSALAQRFQIDGESGTGAGEWRLALLPLQPSLARWVQRVELQGDRFLRSIRMHEASGDQTQIRLARHATGSAITADEEAQFE
ncbi:LolA family protein [Ramlibacter henchirensis]|uniref:LolA family protein n=1 Tax=Ramlibacter henchirensis TaxID=204072 RepID=UPI00142F9A99|nr:outer membrane lipoprotein carrier protein LolA [Ramlibacter henchirensis]